ncbi:DUF2470 domain-containing protein [Veronia pacifica]|uniref:DUF2470 domain-containing protein n=1 Tax=Veronia pacifica TaxID=1080227 RepID=A0A1C3E8X6_9GAMM|nr:DUF2470 domain-containing protein [Veronia pacifica]ODA29690.1 hypothetical protein A8L45_21940 [Veronia pacifica]
MAISQEHLAGIISHMNDDHEDALVLYAHAFVDRKDVTSAKLVDLDRDTITLELADGERLIVPVTAPIETAGDAHKVLVAMVKQGREKLAS